MWTIWLQPWRRFIQNNQTVLVQVSICTVSMAWRNYRQASWMGFSKQWKAIKNCSSKLSYQDFVLHSWLNGADIPSILLICVPCCHKVAYLCSYRFILFGDGHKNSSFSELINKITTNVSKILWEKLLIFLLQIKCSIWHWHILWPCFVGFWCCCRWHCICHCCVNSWT